MEDLKKWTVTYTKHLKQKRKVYQDGFLHIHSSTRKTSAPYKKPCIRSSDDDDLRCSERLPADKPLRNAQSIMSILRKPITHEGITTIAKEPVASTGESEIDVEADKMVNCIIVQNDKSVEPIN